MLACERDQQFASIGRICGPEKFASIGRICGPEKEAPGVLAIEIELAAELPT